MFFTISEAEGKRLAVRLEPIDHSNCAALTKAKPG